MKTKKNAYLGLETRTYPKCKRWQVDYDYTETLKIESPAAAALLSQFTNEFVGAKVGDNALHNTDKLRRDCYHRSDCCRRDLFSVFNSIDRVHQLVQDQQSEDDDVVFEREIDPNAIFHGENYTVTTPATPTKPQPVKVYTPEELEAFAKSRGLKVSRGS